MSSFWKFRKPTGPTPSKQVPPPASPPPEEPKLVERVSAPSVSPPGSIRLTLAAPCVRRYDLLQALLWSAERGTLKPDKYYVVDNGLDLIPRMIRKEINLPPNTYVHTPQRPLGVAGAWNQIMRENEDLILISNDDVELGHDTARMLAVAAMDPDADFVCPSGDHGAMFCVFIPKKSLWNRIGPFDERFYPAYFEDNDYHQRMKLVSAKEVYIKGAHYSHVGSATLKSLSGAEMNQHHTDFDKNRTLYVQKWGGLPGQETNKEPAC